MQQLLDRDQPLSVPKLDADVPESSVVLLTSEAGIGKTSVVRAFLAEIGNGVPLLVGACDNLLRPARPDS
ncbi:hypothetical protein [Kribbella sp. CA-294648]|uniref:hypothetical protein n=1 Tax=Kribbella sp. CA-294648 TaxID=3239948 RepID=UPI003D8F9F53